MNPASVMSTLIKLEGIESASVRLKEYDALAARTSKSADKFTSATREQGKAARETGGHMGSMVKGLVAAGGAFMAYGAAKDAVKDTIDLTEATIKLSAITGQSSKDASTWIEIFKARGVATTQVSMGFITLSKQMESALGGSAKSEKAFKDLGVSLDDLRKLNTNQLIGKIADGMRQLRDPTMATADAALIFGRNAKSLIPILSQGSGALREQFNEAQRYGAYISGGGAEQLKKAKEAQIQFNYAMAGVKIAFTEAVLPYLVQGAKGISNFINQVRTGQGIGGQFANVFSTSFNAVKTVITATAGAVGGFGNLMRIMLAAFVASKVYEMVGAVKALSIAFSTSPVGLFVSAIAGIGVGLALLQGSERTTAEITRQMTSSWQAARTAADALRDSALGIKQTALDVLAAKQREKEAHDAVTDATRKETAAVRDHGAKSKEAKQATKEATDADLAWKQAKLDVTRATNSHRDSIKDNNKAIDEAKAKARTAVGSTQALIDKDREHIGVIKDTISKIKASGIKTSELKVQQDNLRGATDKLKHDTGLLGSQLNSLPKSINTSVGVAINFSSNIAGAISSISNSVGGAISNVANVAGAPKHARGGLVTSPGYFAGEEAPRHPEVIVATNPAYRRRNLGLWATAGSMLGVPGFAQGGITEFSGQEVGAAPGWASKEGADWVTPYADTFIKNAATRIPAARMYAAASSIIGLPYVWGGGHGGFSAGGYDCSGAVSFVLHAGGFLGSPMTTDGLKNWGAPGAGQYITVGVRGSTGRSAHTMMDFYNHYFESGGGGGGPHWDSGWDGAFPIMRHPPGYQRGGIYSGGDFGEMPPTVLLSHTPQLAKDPKFIRYAKNFGMGGFAKGGIKYPHWPRGREWNNHHGYTWFVNYVMKNHKRAHPGIPPGSGEWWNWISQYFHHRNGDLSNLPTDAYDPGRWRDHYDRGYTGYKKGGIPSFARGGVSPAWRVMASQETDGGTGAFGFSPGGVGYSILGMTGRTSDGSGGAGYAFGSRKSPPRPMFIRSAGGGTIITATLQDIGAGSDGMNPAPSIGLYSGASSQIGANKLVDVMLTSGAAFTSRRGTPIGVFAGKGSTGSATPVSSVPSSQAEALKRAAAVRKASVPAAIAKIIASLSRRIPGAPGYLNPIIDDRNREVDLLTAYGHQAQLGADYVTQDASGNWIIKDNTIAAQLQQMQSMENSFLVPAQSALTDEWAKTQTAVEAIKRDLAKKLMDQWWGILKEIFRVRGLILKQQAYIAVQNEKLKKAKKQKDKLLYTKNIAKAQAQIGDYQKALGKDYSDTSAGTLYGDYNQLMTTQGRYKNTGTALNESMSYYGDDRRISTFPDATAPFVVFHSMLDTQATLSDNFESLHRDMAALGATTTPTSPPDVSGAGGASPLDDVLATQLKAAQSLNRTYAAQMDTFSRWASAGATGPMPSWATTLQSFAAGGISSGGYALVGEKGPEIANFPSGTRIFSNSDSSGMLSPTINVQVVMHGDVDKFVKEVEVVVDGKKAEIVSEVNNTIGYTVGMARQTPSAPGKMAKY